MVALTPVLEKTHVTRNQINDWLGLVRRPKILETKFKETEPGSPRDLSFENAVEIGFVAALIRAGATASKAVEIASGWRKEMKAGKLAPLFAVNPVTLEGYGFSDPSIGYLDLKTMFDPFDEHEHVQVNIIDRAGIVRQMQSLAEEG